jgi:hypothetical protein
METHQAEEDIQRMKALIRHLETLDARIGQSQEECNAMFADIRREYNGILAEVKLQFHESVMAADRVGYDLIPDVPLEDKKIKAAWMALFRHPNGATADVIAEDLHRHRTTVSTYLNTLVLMQFAQKERIGHEILYKALLPRSVGTE